MVRGMSPVTLLRDTKKGDLEFASFSIFTHNLTSVRNEEMMLDLTRNDDAVNSFSQADSEGRSHSCSSLEKYVLV